MIISRTTFRLKYGQAKPAIAIWKEILEHLKGSKEARPTRLMSDLSGQNYTLVNDIHLRGFMDIGPGTHVWLSDPRIRELYPKFVPMCESSTSEMYHIEHQVGNLQIAPGSIVEQMTFRLKYGQAQQACVIWKKILDEAKNAGIHMRLFTDITGPSYTMIIDQHYGSMMEYGPHKHVWMSHEPLRELYKEFVPLADSSFRTLFHMEFQG